MSIKIRKKVERPENPETAEVEDEALEQAEAGEATTDEVVEAPDAFELASYRTASWVETNRNLVLGGLAAAVVAVVGIFLFANQQKGAQVEASNALTAALVTHEMVIDGSSEHKAMTSDPKLPKPSVTYPTDQARWEKVYEQADAALKSHGSGPLADAARMSKAAAAFQLNKLDEARELYEKALAGKLPEEARFHARYGYASTLGAAGETDKAIAELDKLAAESEGHASLLAYDKARLLQSAGKVEEAKKMLHEILEKYPEASFRTDVERRLALL